MISHLFIDRPILATVLSVVIVIVGLVALLGLPIAQYPEVTPPTVQVTATYPGANAKTVADTVAFPIEQEVNGVERMLYMSSKCTNDGQMNLDITFELGTNLDTAQVLVQNRVAVAEAKLPEEVKRIGVTTKKKSPSILMCVNLISTKKPGTDEYFYNQLYLSNFATLNVKDDLARLKGVGDVAFLGPRDYSMRVWLDPDKLAGRKMVASDVIAAVREQNRQVAAGRLGQPPVPANTAVPFQLPLNTEGRLTSEEQFGDIILKTNDKGALVQLKDVVRTVYNDDGTVKEKGIELGAKNYDVNSYLDGEPSVTLAIFQLPGSNALDTAEAIRGKMEELKGRFPEGVEYRVYYDTTVFINESVASVVHTLIEAFILVFIVVLVFLQNWRATIIPMVAVPVSLIGTLGVMSLLGFSLNNLSLFGLVLAIGIVVDDAIVVVENVETWLARGLSPRDAARKAMDEVTGPVIAIGLVLCSVFVPTAFMAGISGQFFKQFALTIAASTVISAFNSLTLSPALCAILLKPHVHGEHGHTQQEALPPLGIALIGGLLAYFFLLGPIGHLFGVEIGGHGHSHSPAPNRAVVWSLRAGVFIVGVVAGLLAAAIINRGLGAFFRGFNWVFDVTINGYGKAVGILLRLSAVALIVYAGLMGLTFLGFKAVPVGFIPEQDKGYLVLNAQLPDGASLDRTNQLVKRLSKLARKDKGVDHTIDLPGYSVLVSTNISNVGGMFVILKPFEERAGKDGMSGPEIIKRLRARFTSEWYELDDDALAALKDEKEHVPSDVLSKLESLKDQEFTSRDAFLSQLDKTLGGEQSAKYRDTVARLADGTIRDGRVALFGAPPVDGFGSTGGFKLQVQDRRGAGLRSLQGAVQNLADEGNRDPKLVGLFSSFSVTQPQLFIDIDNDKAKAQKIKLKEIDETLQASLGSFYVNDFFFQNRNWQVNIQTRPRYRVKKDDIGNLEVRNDKGDRVPLATLVKVRYESGPAIVNHYNLFPSAEINGNTAPGVSSGQAITIMDNLGDTELPSTMGSEWTELTLQQILAGQDIFTKLAFPLAVVFVVLVLAAQYESWSLPVAIVLIVPMCLLAAIAGIWLMKMDNNLFTQIGLVVLIGLAAKNAILIVEFAKQLQDQGKNRFDATVEASRMRLRPILMTSFAFILGVVPLVLAKGAGAEMRVALGVAVFSGMLGVTIFGIFFTPVFYVVIRWLTERKTDAAAEKVPAVAAAHDGVSDTAIKNPDGHVKDTKPIH